MTSLFSAAPVDLTLGSESHPLIAAYWGRPDSGKSWLRLVTQIGLGRGYVARQDRAWPITYTLSVYENGSRRPFHTQPDHLLMCKGFYHRNDWVLERQNGRRKGGDNLFIEVHDYPGEEGLKWVERGNGGGSVLGQTDLILITLDLLNPDCLPPVADLLELLKDCSNCSGQRFLAFCLTKADSLSNCPDDAWRLIEDYFPTITNLVDDYFPVVAPKQRKENPTHFIESFITSAKGILEGTGPPAKWSPSQPFEWVMGILRPQKETMLEKLFSWLSQARAGQLSNR